MSADGAFPDEPDERSRLLAAGEGNAKPERKRALAFYLALSLIFLVQAGIAAAIAPTTAILESQICERYYGSSEASTQPVDCKVETVQSRLAMMRGVASMTSMIPGIFLVVPYGLLADKYGPRPVMVLSVAGILLTEIFYDLVCWQGAVWPLELLWATPIFYLLGGGPPTFVSLLFVVIANASPPDTRSSRFFQLEAASYLGNISSYLLSSVLMDRNPWIPVLLGLVFIAIAGCLLIGLSLGPESGPVEAGRETQRGERPHSPRPHDSLRDSGSRKATAAMVPLNSLLTAIFRIMKQQRAVLILLGGYWLRMLAVSVTRLQLVYISRLFEWKHSQAAYMVSLDSAVHLVTLLLLPLAAGLLVSRLRCDSLTKDWWLARFSIVLAVVGCAGMAFSPTPVLMALSVILFGLGAGYSASIRGAITSLTAVHDRALIYSTMSMLDTIGSLIGAPLWPLVYRLGLKAGGFLLGLPFAVAAAMFALVYSSVEVAKFTATAYF